MTFQENLRNLIETLDKMSESIKQTELTLEKVPFDCTIQFKIDDKPAELGWSMNAKRITFAYPHRNIYQPLLECTPNIMSVAFPHVKTLVEKITNGITTTIKELETFMGEQI